LGASSSADGPSQSWLGDEVLDDAGTVADNIETTFGAHRYFSDDEARRLIFQRELPASVRPHAEASAELLESVDDLWRWIGQTYREKWDRAATAVERRWIGEFAVSILRPASPDRPSPVVRPVA
jgi:hypothetical protein